MCLAQEENSASSFLNTEREIIAGNIQQYLEFPKNLATRVLLANTLLSRKKARPDILHEFKDQVTLLQKEKQLSTHEHVIVQQIFDEAFLD